MKKILLTGFMLSSFFAFSQSAGSLDASFGTGGKVVTSINSGADKAYATAIQADGKILVVGVTTSGATGKDFAIVRYNADGTLDTAFGTNGIVTSDLQGGSDDVAYSMALLADGKIVLAGYSDDGSQKKAAIVRYTAMGALDTDFGTGGKVYTSFEGTLASEIKVIKVHLATGNLVVGGNAAVSSTKAKPVIARFTAAGALDTNFNTTGIKTLWLSTNDQQYQMTVEDLVVQANGKISAVGWEDFPSLPWDSDYWLCRINSNGTMDTGFSGDGVNVLNGTFNGHDRAYGLLLKDDNSMVVAGGGYVTDLNYSATLFEITPAGVAAGTSSQSNIPYASLNDAIAYDVELDNDGKFVMTGSNGTAAAKTFAISRVNSNYTIDTTFDTDGKVTTAFGSNAVSEAFDAAIQPDNKIVAVGYTGNDFAVARYLGTAATSGTDEFAKNAINLYPNPAGNLLNITTADAAANAYTIFDVNGRAVIKSKATSLNIENLQSGVYILRFDDNGASAKFVKQ